MGTNFAVKKELIEVIKKMLMFCRQLQRRRKKAEKRRPLRGGNNDSDYNRRYNRRNRHQSYTSPQPVYDKVPSFLPQIN